MPLVDHMGSMASKRKWDDKGAFKINRQRSPRFAADSYLGEKPFIKDQPLPKDVPDGNHKFNRAPSHVFPGLKKPLAQKYIDDKKTLIKSIIQGKEKVSSFRDLIVHRKTVSEDAAAKARRKKLRAIEK